MIDVARDVAAVGGVARPPIVDFEDPDALPRQIALLAPPRLRLRDQLSLVFDDVGVFLDRLRRVDAPAGDRRAAADDARELVYDRLDTTCRYLFHRKPKNTATSAGSARGRARSNPRTTPSASSSAWGSPTASPTRGAPVHRCTWPSAGAATQSCRATCRRTPKRRIPGGSRTRSSGAAASTTASSPGRARCSSRPG